LGVVSSVMASLGNTVTRAIIEPSTDNRN